MEEIINIVQADHADQKIEALHIISPQNENLILEALEKANRPDLIKVFHTFKD